MLDQLMLYIAILLRQSGISLDVPPQELEVSPLPEVDQYVADQNEGRDYIVLNEPAEGLLVLFFRAWINEVRKYPRTDLEQAPEN